MSYGIAGNHLVRCNADTGAVDWVDPLDEEEPHRLFDATKECTMWPVAGGIAAYDPNLRALQFVEHPSDPAAELVVLAGEYVESENPSIGGGSNSWPEHGVRRSGRTWPVALAEPWISLDVAGFRKGNPAIHLRTYNLEDGEKHNFASELVTPPAREAGDIVGFRPWSLEGSLSPDVMVVSVPADPFSWDVDPVPHLYRPYTGELQALDLPYDPHPIKTDAGLYWAQDGLRLLTNTQEVVVMAEARQRQIVMADGRVAQVVDDQLRLFAADGSSEVLDDGVSSLHEPPRPLDGARADLEDLFYVADGMVRRVPLP